MPPGLVWELALVKCPITMELVWMVMTHYCHIVHVISFLSLVWFQCCARGRSLLYGMRSNDMKSLLIIGGLRVDVGQGSYVFWGMCTELYNGIL